MEESKLLHSLIIIILSVFVFLSVSNATDFKAIVRANETNLKEWQDKNKQVVTRAKAAFANNTNKIKTIDESILSQVIASYKNQASKPKEKQGLIIFVSFSMPKEMLENYFEQAKLYGARMVIRGLVNNSFKDTIKKMDLRDNKKLVADIDPKLFKRFNITKVPAIVQIGEDGYDKFVGSVSIKYVLEEIQKNKSNKLLDALNGT